jgi:hypothetical protein
MTLLINSFSRVPEAAHCFDSVRIARAFLQGRRCRAKSKGRERRRSEVCRPHKVGSPRRDQTVEWPRFSGLRSVADTSSNICRQDAARRFAVSDMTPSRSRRTARTDRGFWRDCYSTAASPALLSVGTSVLSGLLRCGEGRYFNEQSAQENVRELWRDSAPDRTLRGHTLSASVDRVAPVRVASCPQRQPVISGMSSPYRQMYCLC